MKHKAVKNVLFIIWSYYVGHISLDYVYFFDIKMLCVKLSTLSTGLYDFSDATENRHITLPQLII